MIIVPHLRWRTFRYWAVRASDVQGIGSSPIGDTGQFLYWLWPHYQHKPTLNMQTSFNPSSVASSLQLPCNNNVLRLFLPVSCTKSTINQKEWHVATKRLMFSSKSFFFLPFRNFFLSSVGRYVLVRTIIISTVVLLLDRTPLSNPAVRGGGGGFENKHWLMH